MTLRVRLNVLVSTLFVVIVSFSAAVVIVNARKAIEHEVSSAARLTIQLLDIAIAGSSTGENTAGLSRLMDAIETVDAGRHVNITIEANNDGGSRGRPSRTIAAPGWFVDWVSPDDAVFRRAIGDATIVVATDPADEIEEAWEDARNMLGLIVLFSIVANGLFFGLVGRWFKPLTAIGSALDEVQQGNYRQRLPSFDLPELSDVAAHFNRMTEVLEKSREENRLLAQKTLAIQEQERRALAHELHDELGQSISAIKAVAVSIDDGNGSDVRNAVSVIAEISSHIYSVVRGLMTRLRPVLLDEFGIVPALQDLIDTWNARAVDSFCRFEVQGVFDDLDEDQMIGIFRIVQEALTNVTKHARAINVAVTLGRSSTGSGASILLGITDDGIGFSAGPRPVGLGLLGIRERVDSLGGLLAIEAAPGRGVTLTVRLPVRRLVVAA
jgi:two-component system sensor histidine kinase UhpB